MTRIPFPCMVHIAELEPGSLAKYSNKRCYLGSHSERCLVKLPLPSRAQLLQEYRKKIRGGNPLWDN